MPRFFFHEHDGKIITDHDGTELADLQAARLNAIAVAGRILSDVPERIGLGEDWCMDVTDATGLILFKLDFHVAEAPAVRGDRLTKEWPS